MCEWRPATYRFFAKSCASYPQAMARKLEERSLETPSESNGEGGAGGSKNLKKVLVLDVRNGYYLDLGCMFLTSLY